MSALVELLYQISTALLMPVVIGLLLLLALTLLELGGFLREGWERRSVRPLQGTAAGQLTIVPRGLVRLYQRHLPADADDAACECIFADLEVEASARVARLHIGLRLGPTLGLIGTLIPLGPALQGLAAGQSNQIAENLIIAFTTTVVGLLISGLCFVLATVRRHWYASDLSTVRYLVALQVQSDTALSIEGSLDGHAAVSPPSFAGRN